MNKPEQWPNVISVLGNSGGWDGIAVDPDDDPVVYLRRWLKDIGDTDTNPDELWDSNDWERVEWDGETYSRPRYENSKGHPIQYERSYNPDDLSYLPDQYGEQSPHAQ